MVSGRSLGVLAVVALVALAGCPGLGANAPGDGSGGADGDGSVGGDDGSGDATPVETVAPGVADAGVVNRSALLGAHRASLNDSGFVYRVADREVERLHRPDEGDRRSLTVASRSRVAAAPGLVPYRATETDSDGTPNVTEVRYVGAGGGARRTVRGGNATVEPYDESPTVLLTTHYLVGDFLAEGNWTVTERRDDAVVLEAGPGWSDWTSEDAGDLNVSERLFFDGELVVSRDGVVRRLTVNQTTVERVAENGTLRSKATSVRTVDFEVVRTGNVSVERPAWVSDVVNGTERSGSVDAPS